MKQYNRHIKEAIEAVRGAAVPDDYKVAAFQVIFERSLEKAPQQRRPGKPDGPALNIDPILNSHFDWTKVGILDMPPGLQNLEILRIAKTEFKTNLTAHNIRMILNQKFRISKSWNAISMSLMKEVGKHIERTKKNGIYYYEITDTGISYLNSRVNKNE